ncbi:MAG TPA: TIGR04552 family protein [Polyangia bacterium]|nr:TIGR04552 family protein [Polyangia bacterium]
MSIPENATPPTPGAPAAERPTEQPPGRPTERPTERPAERPSTAERARKVRYEDFKLSDLTAIRNVLRGGSVIDWHRLHFTERDEVDRFLRVNEIDPSDADDLRRLADLRELAVEYLERHLNFYIPEELSSGIPPRDLLLVASQKGKRRTHACIVLKVMHVLHHLAGRELLTKLPVSGDQLFHLVEDKVLRTVEEIKAVGCQVIEFEWSRKPTDSLITKLLAKKESIAADVYDNLRFRMITSSEEQLPFVLRELVQRLVPFNYVIPGQSVNDIVKIRETLSRSPALQRFLPEITDLAAVAADKKPAVQNEFSGPGYRVINFVADLPVRVDKYLCRPADDPLFAENGTVVFVLTEFQIIDARTAENNERGENSHEKYKERQFARVKARLMHGMKDESAD